MSDIAAKIPRLTRMGRLQFDTVTKERAAHLLAPEFSKLLQTYICPYELVLISTTGYWSHNAQDVQKFTGHYKSGPIGFDFGSWDMTLTDITRSRFEVHDIRDDRKRATDFEIARPPRKANA